MKNWKTSNGTQIHQVLSGRSNAFLIATYDLNILVDTGYKFSFKKLLSNISSLKLSNGKVDYLILTHTHFDHCHNAARIKNMFNCKIILSENERIYAEKGFTPIPAGTGFFTRLLIYLGKRIDLKLFHYSPFRGDILITKDYELESMPFPVKIISTEGHSSGSISVIVDNEIAIVGDVMIGIFSDTVFPPFADNVKQMVNSWKKLLDTGCKIFLSGHGSEIKRDFLQQDYEKYSKEIPK